MSLAPMLFSHWWEELDRPHTILDQQFGLPADPEDFAHHRSRFPMRHSEHLGYPFFRRTRRRHHPFHHALAQRYQSGKDSTFFQTDREKFLVTLDVQQFEPDEITVRTIDKNVIVIEARHEEKEDEHGWISRQFLRKYIVPPYCDIEQVESLLSSDGVLTITAPRKKILNAERNERNVKIQYTGEPAIFDYPKTPSRSIEGPSAVDDPTRDHPQQRGQMMQQRGKKITVKGT